MGVCNVVPQIAHFCFPFLYHINPLLFLLGTFGELISSPNHTFVCFFFFFCTCFAVAWSIVGMSRNGWMYRGGIGSLRIYELYGRNWGGCSRGRGREVRTWQM